MICCSTSSLAMREFATGPGGVKLSAMPNDPDQQPDPVKKLGDQATGGHKKVSIEDVSE